MHFEKQVAMRRSIVVLTGLLILLSLAAHPSQAQSSAWSLQILEADARHLLLELTLSAFESEMVSHDGVGYQRLRVADWGHWGQPGQPRLPMHSVPLGMPGPGNPQVSVIEAESETLEEVLLHPVPTLELGGTEDTPQIVETFVLDSGAYSADTFYPGPLTEAASIGLLRDQPIFQLRLYPFQYNPLRRELRFYHRLQVRVTFPEAPLSLAEASRAPPITRV